jgi:hypothetical protein
MSNLWWFRSNFRQNHQKLILKVILEDETVSIKIPAGVVDGMQLKVSNKGNDAQETVFQEI